MNGVIASSVTARRTLAVTTACCVVTMTIKHWSSSLPTSDRPSCQVTHHAWITQAQHRSSLACTCIARTSAGHTLQPVLPSQAVYVCGHGLLCLWQAPAWSQPDMHMHGRNSCRTTCAEHPGPLCSSQLFQYLRPYWCVCTTSSRLCAQHMVCPTPCAAHTGTGRHVLQTRACTRHVSRV